MAGDDEIDEAVCGPRPYETPHHADFFERIAKAVARIVRASERPDVLPPIEPAAPSFVAPTHILSPAGPLARIRLGEPGWTWPMERAPDGRAPVVSDGRHPKGDMRFRNGVGHRGVDIMYRKRTTAPKGALLNHPWESRGFEVMPQTNALAAAPGRVTVAKWLATGYAVAMDHGFGVETAYHHLSALKCRVGDELPGGATVGIVGCPPATVKTGGKPGLVHLHFDLLIGGKFVDSEPYLKTWIVSPRLPLPPPPPLVA